MGKYCATMPERSMQSSYGFFASRMIVRPITNRKSPKGIEVVRRSALNEYREHKNR